MTYSCYGPKPNKRISSLHFSAFGKISTRRDTLTERLKKFENEAAKA